MPGRLYQTGSVVGQVSAGAGLCREEVISDGCSKPGDSCLPGQLGLMKLN